MKPNTKYKLKMAAARIISVIDIPFLILAYPHILYTRRVRALMKDAMRLEFVRNGMCGGCSRFGTKRCHSHVKNPYAVLGKGCLVAD